MVEEEVEEGGFFLENGREDWIFFCFGSHQFLFCIFLPRSRARRDVESASASPDEAASLQDSNSSESTSSDDDSSSDDSSEPSSSSDSS